MLKREQAHKELEKLRPDDWQDRLAESVGALPGGLSEIGLHLLGRKTRTEKFKLPLESATARRAAVGKLDRLAGRDRQRLFEALLPPLGRHLDAAWQLQRRLPYEFGYERKPFRAPNNPELTLTRRMLWLDALLDELGGYGQDIAWCAAWAPYFGYSGGDAVGVLVAAALEAEGPEANTVFDILCDSARGQHAIGAMGRHVTRALLVAARPDGWEFIEKLLLAAQRQEGLRQVILETVDEAHPEAFRRMLRLIRDNDLARFSATVRAVNVWFGFGWDANSARAVEAAIDMVLTYLDDSAACAQACRTATGDALYLALWAQAFEDAAAAIKPAAALLGDGSVERRFIAVHLLGQLELAAARQALLPILDDEDLGVAVWAAESVTGSEEEESDAPKKSELFERLERLLARLPTKKTKLKPIVWPWCVPEADRAGLARDLLTHLGDRPPTRLLPHLGSLDAWGRADAVRLLAEQKRWDATTRGALFALVGDSSSDVREKAVQALRPCKIGANDATGLETLLTRKASDLRRGVLALLLGQKDAVALASADRLLTSADALQRLAGLEILRELSAQKRLRPQCQARAEEFRAARPRRSKEEEKLLAGVSEAAEDRPTLDNALGLMNPAERAPIVPPRKLSVQLITPAALALLEALDKLVDEHREDAIIIKHRREAWDYEENEELEPDMEEEGGQTEGILGEVEWQFPGPQAGPLETELEYLPLRELWEKWWQERPTKLRDRDGFEVLRAMAWLQGHGDDLQECLQEWRQRSASIRKALDELSGGQQRRELDHEEVIDHLLNWFWRMSPTPRSADFVLDALETSYAHVPAELLTHVPREDDWEPTWRDYDSPFLIWEAVAQRHQWQTRNLWTGAQHVRYWQLLHWKSQPAAPPAQERPALTVLLAAYQAGGATDADLIDDLLGPRSADRYGDGGDFSSLRELTSRKPAHWLRDNPHLGELVERCRQRILEVELARGDTETAASRPALSLTCVWGSATLARVLQALGKEPFHRGYAWGESSLGKRHVLTHLVEVSHPAADDTPASFAARLSEAGIDEDRLIGLAFKAPQWAAHVEHALGWPGFTEGLWWFLAHSHGAETGDDQKQWAARVRERTALSLDDLSEGAVDVAWFHRAYEAVGAKHWAQLADRAKFSCDGLGYRRALFLAGVLLGKAKRTELVANIRKKHARESVRALGLLPLATGPARDEDLRSRYQVLHEYYRYARGLGAMSREGALHTAEVGIANLARTAGYADPLRFQWAMEARAVADLAAGPVNARGGDVSVTLALDEQGQPELTVTRKDKPVKSVPKEAKSNKKIAELLERAAELKRSRSHTRQSLEEAMCRGDTFSAAELQELLAHPLLAPSLRNLVFVGEGILGYPERGGKVLRDHAGKLEPIKKSEVLRLAHPFDLLASKQWHEWQHDCFQREMVQPFKQVFRELYVLTAAEKADKTRSHRYAGHQIQPRQAAALWASRGWLVSPEEGVRKTFHDAGLTAEVGFLGDWFTPAEVEGPTLETVQFVRRGEWKPLPLTQVPPRLFSEVMRDLDLVVSVAHCGGVDPEASASTVEMRANLLRETCALLKLKNVRIKLPRALIDGELANYALHLGSGGVHRLPGQHLCIIPVHAQHRGRLFLPFADDDPKTAEILSKALLLARDNEIQDPTILEQLRA
jgi:hypothetical protein